MEMPISRRRLLKLLAAGVGGVCLNKLWGGSDPRLLAEELGEPTLASSVAAGVSAAYPGRVIHVHSPNATSWDFSSGWYGDYVDQAIANDMVDQGVMALTNATTAANAWRAVLPAYVVGQKIAIKINLNNATTNDSDNVIDALPQPINAVIRGLKAIGVAESDIWVYDVTNGWHTGQMPVRLVNKVAELFPGVQFQANTGYSTTEKIHFNVPAGKPAISDRPICNALVNATYLINMPIMKKHGAGVTLGFKNHFGSFDRCDLLHWSVYLDDPAHTSTYNVLVDIYTNQHFKNKTILTIGDGLYGDRIRNYSVPSPWSTFGGHAPNSLFFAIDPVAIDCVMCDFLQAEGGIPTGSDDYLRLAATAGLGVFERGAPWGSGYQQIDYLKVSTPRPPTASVLSITRSDSDVTLTWQHNNVNTSYEVWRDTSPYFTPGLGGSPLAIGLPPSPNCTMVGDTITCTDPDAVGGASPNYYLVRALNMAGAFEDSNRVGAYSFGILV